MHTSCIGCRKQRSYVEEHIFEAGQSLFSVILLLMAQVNSVHEQARSVLLQDADRHDTEPDVRSRVAVLDPD